MAKIFFNKCFECEFCTDIHKNYDEFTARCICKKSKNYNKKINAEGEMCDYRKALINLDLIIE